MLDNANDSYDHFIQVFTDLYNECFPVVQVTIMNKCKKPWITHGLLKSINRKHKLYSNYVKRPNDNNKKKCIDIKNILVRTLRLAKQRYYYDLFQRVKSDIKKTWSHINELLGRGKKNLFPSGMFH